MGGVSKKRFFEIYFYSFRIHKLKNTFSIVRWGNV